MKTKFTKDVYTEENSNKVITLNYFDNNEHNQFAHFINKKVRITIETIE